MTIAVTEDYFDANLSGQKGFVPQWDLPVEIFGPNFDPNFGLIYTTIISEGDLDFQFSDDSDGNTLSSI